MGAALRGVLSVDEGVILLAVLVGVCKGYLYVLTLHVYDGVKRVGGHRVGEQVSQAVAREDAPTVVHDGESGVEIGVVAQHRLHEVVVERVTDEQCRVGFEEDVGAVLVGRVLGDVRCQVAALELERTHLAVAIRLHLEVCREGVHRLHTHAVQTHALLERLRVVLAAGVEHTDCLNELALRYATTIVAHRHTQTVVDVYLYALAGVHLELVDRVVDDLLQQHIDTVLGQLSVAQATDIHTWTCTHVLHVGEVAYVVVGILNCGLNVFFHFIS